MDDLQGGDDVSTLPQLSYILTLQFRRSNLAINYLSQKFTNLAK